MNGLILDRATQIFAALSHASRLRIVELLCSREMTVNEIAVALELGQSGTSQHLAVMLRAGILAVEQHGVSRIYRIRGPRIHRIIDLISEFCEVHEFPGVAIDVENEFRELVK